VSGDCGLTCLVTSCLPLLAFLVFWLLFSSGSQFAIRELYLASELERKSVQDSEGHDVTDAILDVPPMDAVNRLWNAYVARFCNGSGAVPVVLRLVPDGYGPTFCFCLPSADMRAPETLDCVCLLSTKRCCVSPGWHLWFVLVCCGAMPAQFPHVCFPLPPPPCSSPQDGLFRADCQDVKAWQDAIDMTHVVRGCHSVHRAGRWAAGSSVTCVTYSPALGQVAADIARNPETQLLLDGLASVAPKQSVGSLLTEQRNVTSVCKVRSRRAIALQC